MLSRNSDSDTELDISLTLPNIIHIITKRKAMTRKGLTQIQMITAEKKIYMIRSKFNKEKSKPPADRKHLHLLYPLPDLISINPIALKDRIVSILLIHQPVL